MKVVTEEGLLLDAEFDLEDTAVGVDIVLRSRHGGRGSPRGTNVDYFPAPELLLARLSLIGAVIDAISVDSKVALKLPAAERVLDLDYLIRLGPATNIRELRLLITGGQRSVTRNADAKPSGGNNHKRIGISVNTNTLRKDVPTPASVLQNGMANARSAALWTEYRPAQESPSITPADVFTFDPTTRERGLSGHTSVQNCLADFLRNHGIEPHSPSPSRPDFDLALEGIFVAEVKSLSGANEDRQLRLGLGQVLHYRHLLATDQQSAEAVLAVERQPSLVWQEICNNLGVKLSWPPDWPDLL